MMAGGRCSVRDVFRKQTFDAIKALRRDKKMADGKAIHIYFAQCSVTNLEESYVLNAIEVSLEKNLVINTLTREGDLFYLVSEAAVQWCSVKKVFLEIS